jgi:hypothetical protein
MAFYGDGPIAYHNSIQHTGGGSEYFQNVTAAAAADGISEYRTQLDSPIGEAASVRIITAANETFSVDVAIEEEVNNDGENATLDSGSSDGNYTSTSAPSFTPYFAVVSYLMGAKGNIQHHQYTVEANIPPGRGTHQPLLRVDS